MKPTRLIDLLPWQLANHPQKDCIVSKVNGQWIELSTQHVMDKADQMSRALVKFGIKPDDKVALIAGNRPEWNIVDLGILNIGAVNVPIYPTISEGEYNFIFNDAEIKLVIVEDAALYEKVKRLKGTTSHLQEIYTLEKVPGAKHISELLALDTEPTDMTQVQAYRDQVTPDTLATFIYTSGTTGTPKGVMLSHRNVTSNVVAVSEILPLSSEYRALSFLPLCHIFERTVTYCYMYEGMSIYYAESIEALGDNLKEVKPHFFTAVPRLLEKVYEKILAKGNALEGFKKKLFFWALDLGNAFDNEGNNGLWYNMQLAVARKLVFSKFHEALGGEVLGIVTGAAALQTRLAKVFSAADIRVRQGYGQTETSPVLTVDRFEDGNYYLGTVGQVIPGVEVKIGPNDEILAKGPNVMVGYYKRPDLTDETVVDGWIHTGDQGALIKGKYLKITGRVKELFKTSGGKYVAPQVVENKLKESSYIEQIMVIGENQKFVAALIIPSFENVKAWCKDNGVSYSSNEDMVANPEVLKMFRAEIDSFSPNFSHIEQVKRFKLLPQDWSIEAGEMTPTMKVKRKVVSERYADLINDIYNV